MSSPLARILTPVVGAAAALVLLSGCAGSAAAGGSSASTDGATLRVAELSTANYLTTVRNDDYLTKQLAKNGDKVDFVGPFVPGDAYAALKANRADATSTGTAYFDTLNGTGSDFVAFAIEKYTGNSQGIVAAPGSGITSLKDLYGKSVNVGDPGGTGDYLLHRAFEKAGLDISKVTEVNISATSSATAFTSGKVDAWATYDQYLASAEAVSGAKILTTGDKIDSLNWSIHFVNRAFAEKHPAAVKAAYKALVQEAAKATATPTLITDAYEKFGASDAQLAVIKTFAVPTIEPLNAEYTGDLQKLAGQLVDYGFLDKAPDMSTYVVDESAAN
jgi:sulfonate transport system substrate-binding protein